MSDERPPLIVGKTEAFPTWMTPRSVVPPTTTPPAQEVRPSCKTNTDVRLTAFPPGKGPYDRWELTSENTGAIIAKGDMPIDWDSMGKIIKAFQMAVMGTSIQPRGCICPPTSEATCKGSLCPRRGF